jgi:2-methylcitrate dehydratase
MDGPVRAITEYAMALDFGSLPSRAVHATKRHLIDALACAVGALDARPVRIARSIAATASTTFGASVFACPRPTTPEYAAFANATAVRYLDYNDTGIGGHPSDMIAAVLAVAEPMHATGRDVIRAIFAEYEVVAACRRAGFRVRDRHVDQVLAVLGSVVGAGIVLDLTRAQMANAISLAITPNIPMRVVRTGEISDWKGCATAHCGMAAVFAARLAKEGLTGPSKPFEGIAGLYDFLQIGPLNLEHLGLSSDGLSAVEATGFKAYPAEYSAQGPIDAVLALRPALELDAISAVEVRLHREGWQEIGGGQGDRREKWNPATRETADHSLPYLVARALADGEITRRSFTD